MLEVLNKVPDAIDNLTLNSSKEYGIEFTNGAQSRYADLLREGEEYYPMPLVVLNRVEFNGVDTKIFELCDYNGETLLADEEWAAYYIKERSGIANGKVVERNGKAIISTIQGEYTVRKATEGETLKSVYTINHANGVKRIEQLEAQEAAKQRELKKNMDIRRELEFWEKYAIPNTKDMGATGVWDLSVNNNSNWTDVYIVKFEKENGTPYDKVYSIGCYEAILKNRVTGKEIGCVVKIDVKHSSESKIHEVVEVRYNLIDDAKTAPEVDEVTYEIRKEAVNHIVAKLRGVAFENKMSVYNKVEKRLSDAPTVIDGLVASSSLIKEAFKINKDKKNFLGRYNK